MQHLSFSGSHFEIGTQVGKWYQSNGKTLPQITIDGDLYFEQISVYKKHYPELLKYFEGIAAGGDYSEDLLLYLSLTGEINFFTQFHGAQRACTIFGVNNDNGFFVGRNYDWMPAAGPHIGVYNQKNPSCHNWVAISDLGIASSPGDGPANFVLLPADIINDQGLFIGITFAYYDKWSSGLSCMHMNPLIAEKCGTVKEAVALLEKTPVCCPKNFFIADKSGDMAVVEHCVDEYRIVYPHDNVLIKTNHFIHPDLMSKDLVLYKRPAHNTCVRYYEALMKINKKSQTFALNDVSEILTDKSSYIYQKGNDVATIWSLVLDMKQQNYTLLWEDEGVMNSQELHLDS